MPRTLSVQIYHPAAATTARDITKAQSTRMCHKTRCHLSQASSAFRRRPSNTGTFTRDIIRDPKYSTVALRKQLTYGVQPADRKTGDTIRSTAKAMQKPRSVRINHQPEKYSVAPRTPSPGCSASFLGDPKSVFMEGYGERSPCPLVG